MPELPEVESVRQGLHDCIGQKINQVKLGPDHCIKSLVPSQSLPLEFCENQKINSIERRGKFLRILLDEHHLLAHLGMSGVLLYNAEARPHTHITLELSQGILRYSDPRRFGHWELQKLTMPLSSWQKLGPDALDPDLSGQQLHGHTQNSKRSAKDLLLDQGLVAGIGNIYACEALFGAGIHPTRTGMSLSADDWNRMLSSAVVIMQESIKHKGTTFSDYRLTNGKGGSFQTFLKVFQKEGLPCPNCGTPISKITQQNRSTFFCPQCQC